MYPTSSLYLSYTNRYTDCGRPEEGSLQKPFHAVLTQTKDYFHSRDCQMAFLKKIMDNLLSHIPKAVSRLERTSLWQGSMKWITFALRTLSLVLERLLTEGRKKDKGGRQRETWRRTIEAKISGLSLMCVLGAMRIIVYLTTIYRSGGG